MTWGSAAVVWLWADSAMAQSSRRAPAGSSAVERGADLEGAELRRLRADMREKMMEARESAQRLLAIYESEQERLRAEYENRVEYFRRGLIARNEVTRAEQDLARAELRVEEERRYLVETDLAILEASVRDELLLLPGVTADGYSERPMLLRFNGDAGWTLGEAWRIENFFMEAFGRSLPVSAWGQTETHDRLRFDHRDALDVALHPDSPEGRALLHYLRQTGIPYVAFRGALPGASTGAHIHIGRPSPRSWSAVNVFDGKSIAGE
jgi:hypothetical protein